MSLEVITVIGVFVFWGIGMVLIYRAERKLYRDKLTRRIQRYNTFLTNRYDEDK